MLVQRTQGLLVPETLLVGPSAIAGTGTGRRGCACVRRRRRRLLLLLLLVGALETALGVLAGGAATRTLPQVLEHKRHQGGVPGDDSCRHMRQGQREEVPKNEHAEQRKVARHGGFHNRC